MLRRGAIYAAIVMVSLGAWGKKVLDHTSFDGWKAVKNTAVSNNGEWAVYAVDPQEGDGVLTFYNTRNGKSVNINRGYRASFTADGQWGLALIKPEYQATRKAKIAKKKDLDLPQDSLVIVNLTTMGVEKIPSVLNYKIGKKGGNWVSYTSCDTSYVSPKILKEKDGGRPLVVRNLATGTEKVVVKWTGDFVMDEMGGKVALQVKKNKKDSLSYDGIGMVSFPDTSFLLLDRGMKHYGTPVFDFAGKKLAYVASNDSNDTGTRNSSVYLLRLDQEMRTPVEIKSEFVTTAGDTLRPNQFTRPEFSHDGKRLISGVGRMLAPHDTTIVDFEQPALDIWVWNAPYTPPQDLHNATKIKEKTLPVVVNLDNMKQTLIADAKLAKVVTPNRWDGDWALVVDPTEDVVSQQWDYLAPEKMSVVNVNTGESRAIGKVDGGMAILSPADRFVAWYEKKNFYAYEIATGKTVCLTENMPVTIWNEDDDHPMDPEAWGVAGWGADDSAFLVYDKYDIWSLDPKGEKEPVCVTAGEGRKRNLQFRYLRTDPDKRFFNNGDQLLLTVFDYTDKYNGLATMRYGKTAAPAVGVLDGHAYTQVKRALDKDVYTWQRANFSESPDIWLCNGTNFMKARQLTDANPQMKEYNWGTAQLVKWTAYDGKESEGVLYVPEDLDPNKKYPMLCVFYETGSEDLYRHYTMEPSWSWVNYPFYVSRGYVIFVPDIHYTSGIPGESCYNYVCSGAEEMCKRYPWIDKDRIGIDGQSWGGYQTAYLVTRTNMFACAGSGAPVANMTSAFGGIRWESGDSRQGQYEQGQSRIGRNLWEAPELYVANSPVFHANRVNTPLLIMHNDKDGAVPWYQGIEMFMALRRLQKPVWMLQYNGESHNIKARKNRKDITVRLQQFFDHYLKGDPMPKWMKEGIPVERKGEELNYGLGE